MQLFSAFVWYLVVSGPQGGLVVMPSGFDTREQCQEAIVEYQKQPGAGWQLQCVPSGAAFYSDDSDPGMQAVPPASE
ncbi:hypothetical protein EJC49_13390 [Aquibium carbonis]|uniref:Uncharacterized protein n=1 Tax=Aquibium carbonis TaxID=2495581 RepID=A0A429YWU0_9HYPH|nr:hypothetical protein [Aquibium carbonis]RST85916.1 hypothetical protein EJC49_13390 [Aquibium carbonis]